MTTIPEFPKADFYDCARDSERLTHTSSEEAVAYVVDEFLTPDYGESEYADPDDDADKTALDAAMPHLAAAVDAFCAVQDVWACEWIEEITLSPEQVEAMMRTHRPDWRWTANIPDAVPGPDGGLCRSRACDQVEAG